jgi:hypothetical protein
MTKHPSRIKGFGYREAEDSSEEKIIADVKRYGWHVVGVSEDDSGPGFAFTVGLYLRTLQPEILIMGVPFEPAGRVLNAIADYLMAGGEIDLERKYSEFVDGREVIFRRIAACHYRDYLGCAIWFYKHHAPDFPAVQCIWPDLDGRFPHEAGFDQRFASMQTDLSQ